MMKWALPIRAIGGALVVFFLLNCALLSSCSSPSTDKVDYLNEISYSWHYRDLDSTMFYASLAREMAAREGYDSGEAEALNNMAFVCIMRMDYEVADSLLRLVGSTTYNQVELLIANVQHMRLCQRMASNREFYESAERARMLIGRISEDKKDFSAHLTRRIIYAESEYAIVSSTYYYYVGLFDKSSEAMSLLDLDGEVRSDTSQYLNYIYNSGSGGVVSYADKEQRLQEEFELIVRCLLIAKRFGFKFFEANALGDLSHMLTDSQARQKLIGENPYILPAIISEEAEGEADLPILLAQRSLEMFYEYGDAYQIAASHRTLASCYIEIGDYDMALAHLLQALDDYRVEQSPVLCSGIREQLSVVYSALGNKQLSDYNRNIYLDLHEQSRQDRYYEARANMLQREITRLNIIGAAVLATIVILLFLLWLFNHLNKRYDREKSLAFLLDPLDKWKDLQRQKASEMSQLIDNIREEREACRQRISDSVRLNLGNRAKIALSGSILPLIDRILNEAKCLEERNEPKDKKDSRLQYICELAAQIGEYNNVLTQWIQLRKGRISLKIESFPLKDLFSIVAKGKAAFGMKGVELEVLPTSSAVKADKVLTLFMINTLADNSRKATPKGGKVRIMATETDDCVEISVEDNGEGFQDVRPKTLADGHGFGLSNCRGIIESYRKTSHTFDCCSFSVQSEKGKGSKVSFRLPRGVVRMVSAILIACAPIISAKASYHLQMAANYADSAYYSNIRGDYGATLCFADSCLWSLNNHYMEMKPDGTQLLKLSGDYDGKFAEISWLRDSIESNFNIILDIRNESAVAALALNQWDIYHYNNAIFTQLYKELSADNTLESYCNTMLKAQANRTIGIIILVVLLLMIAPVYYLVYYRPMLHFRINVDRIRRINQILESDSSAKEMLDAISAINLDDSQSKSLIKAENSLHKIVADIRESLLQAVKTQENFDDDLSIANDEVRRLQAEEASLHISNSVTDNSLSSLKHETMYYPDRIRILADKAQRDGDTLEALRETVEYYREIYSMLSRQAASGLRPLPVSPLRIGEDEGLMVIANKEMLAYMYEILRKQASGDPTINISKADDDYVVISAILGHLETDVAELFIPSVRNIPFLLCRQIVSDLSERTNRRRCGITAKLNSDGLTCLEIALPRQHIFR